jgi:hypothetical protein
MTRDEKAALLDRLERAYFSGVVSMHDEVEGYTFASSDALWTAILRLRSDQESTRPGGGKRPVCGYGVMDKGY